MTSVTLPKSINLDRIIASDTASDCDTDYNDSNGEWKSQMLQYRFHVYLLLGELGIRCKNITVPQL